MACLIYLLSEIELVKHPEYLVQLHELSHFVGTLELQYILDVFLLDYNFSSVLVLQHICFFELLGSHLLHGYLHLVSLVIIPEQDCLSKGGP